MTGCAGGVAHRPRLLIRGLVTTNMALLARATRDDTIFPEDWVERLHEAHAAAGENRIGFAIGVLALIHEVIHKGLSADLETQARRALTAVPRIHDRLMNARSVFHGFDTFLHRTHHKLMLADREWFIMGGRNLADAYHCPSPPKDRPFVDTDVLVRDAA